LGAKDASHAEHYTAASASHIRVLLKGDTLGLGAKRASERAENFGLAGLESILGRLNGREADVKKEEKRREEIERRGWVARKYGYMNFVSGGFLVGDKIEKGVKRLPQTKMEVRMEVREEVSVGEKKSKKRKCRGDAERDDGTKAEDEGDNEQPSLKRKKKSMDLRDEAAKSGGDGSRSERSNKKEKKEKKPKEASVSGSATTGPSSILESPVPGSREPLSEKAKRKAEKRARKEEKKLKKALKKAAKESARSSKSANESVDDSSSSESEEERQAPASGSLPTSGASTPGAMFGSGARHAVRQRYIRQKKMASMDPQALKEVSACQHVLRSPTDANVYRYS
jgi:Pin2-interacting protein X1